MSWLKTLTKFGNRFGDARLPDGFPDEQLTKCNLVDLGYQLLYDESTNAYPTVKCHSKQFVLLSDVYRDPVPFLRILQRRILKCTAKIVLNNFADVIPFRLLLLHDNGGKKNQCKYLERESYRWGWDVAADLLKADGRAIFSPQDLTASDRAQSIKQTMPQWEISDDGEAVIIYKWKLRGADESAKQIADFMIRTEAQGLLLPSHFKSYADSEMRKFATSESTSYPRAAFMGELQQLAQQAVIFSHYLFSKFADEVQDDYHFHHPQEGLSWRLYSWQMVNTSRDQLLNEIQKRFPTYNFHPMLSTTVLTAPEMEEKIRPNQPQSVGAPAKDTSASSRPGIDNSQAFSYKTKEGPSVRLKVQPLDPDLLRYEQVFDMQLNVVSLAAEVVSLEEADFPDAALAIAKQIPDLKDTWSNKPALDLVDPGVFWNPSTLQQYGGGQAERLAYALFCSVHSNTPQWLVDVCINDLLARMFLDPLRPDDWIAYRLDTEPSSFFINDYWDYLWVVFHRNGKHVRVLYGTDTD